jgi:hypothetical protein
LASAAILCNLKVETKIELFGDRGSEVDPILKVVCLCSNQILAYGMKELFINCGDIVYYYVSPHETEELEFIPDPDVFILEESLLHDAKIQELIKKYHSSFIYLNLTHNEMIVVHRKIMGLEHAKDLLEVVRGCKS